MKHWILTHTGKQFSFENPTSDMISLEDIAHALTKMCRFNGHCDRFYSVAEHSLRVSLQLPDQLKLWGLLHDATEAYLPDVTRPLKQLLPEFKLIEHKVLVAIAQKFELDLPYAIEVTKADMRMLKTEKLRLFSEEAATHAWDPQIEALEPYTNWVNFDLNRIESTYTNAVIEALKGIK